jgi:hypothetical protein
MTDERFEFELRSVLRDIAGGEAPTRLRYRLADVTAQAPSRWVWFSTPLRLATAAVAVIAVLALAFVFMPRESIGPGPSSSPTPTASVKVESAQPSPSATAAPSPTQAPTAAPTPVPPSWTSLEWSDPIVPFPYEPPVYVGQAGTSAVVNDIAEWDGGYVGVGSIDRDGSCAEAGFFRSADGLHWQVAFRAPSGEDRTPTMCPRFVATVGNRLVALAQERIWQSTDGVSWTELDPTSLRAIWAGRGEQVVDVAAGPAGIIVIGQPENAFASIVAFSSDGREWTPIALPARKTAVAWDATAWHGGFVVVGRDGQADEGGSPSEPYTHPGVGAPAAWLSTDGLSWTQAQVEGRAIKAGVLSGVVVGAGGLIAIGNDVDVERQYEEIDTIGINAWTSADGLSWRSSGLLGGLVPEAGMLATDGTNIVALRDGRTAWISTDGHVWVSISVTGELQVPSYLFDRLHVHEASTLSMWDTKLWVTSAGLIVTYTVDSPEGFAVKQLQLGSGPSP